MYRCVLILSSILLAVPTQAQTSDDLQTQGDGVAGFTFVATQDGNVGSTMTLQQLQRGKKADAVPEPLQVEPAAEPTPALKYRLYPARSELRPGSALLHYMRAQLLFSQMPKEKQSEWQQLFGPDRNPSDPELAAAVVALQHVYVELHDLALSEDQTWDHRIRDLRGPSVYSYLLPDVQEVRVMARLLRLKTEFQLRQRDFEGALSSISDTVRLAEFVGQGETLIQKLVGIAIAAIVRDSVQQAISIPGCPNLYWALATVPQPLVNIHESLLWELHNIHHVLPALDEAETATWTEAESVQKWSSLLEDLKTLGAFDSGSKQVQLALVVASVTFVDAAQERLLASGVPEERFAKLPSLQIVLMDASRELRRVGDDVGKMHLLPMYLAEPQLQHEDERFQQWVGANRMSSVGAAIAGLLFPAIRQTKQAEARMLLGHHRLMTLEALRMHVAMHNGELPVSLDVLSPVPAMPDPYTNKQLDYKVETSGNVKTVVLTAAGPLNFKALQELRVQFVKSK